MIFLDRKNQNMYNRSHGIPAGNYTHLNNYGMQLLLLLFPKNFCEKIYSCGVCEFDARKCQRPAGKVCIVFSPDEKKIAEVLK